MIGIRRATDDDRAAAASVLGEAFAEDPMIRWPFPVDATQADVTRMFDVLLAVYLPLEVVWVTEDLNGAAVWLPPTEARRFEEIDRSTRDSIRPLTDEDGARYEAFWDWVAAHIPDEPCYFLDAIGVHPRAQGRGLGRSLIEPELHHAFAEGLPAFLETGNPDNVPMYEHLGFRTVESSGAPDGGPTIWFMRADP